MRSKKDKLGISSMTALSRKYNVKYELVRDICYNLTEVETKYKGRHYNNEDFEEALDKYYKSFSDGISDDALDTEKKRLVIKSMKLDIGEREGNLVSKVKVIDFFKKHVALFSQQLKDICFSYNVPADKYNQYVTSIRTEISEYIQQYELDKILEEDIITEVMHDDHSSKTFDKNINEEPEQTGSKQPSEQSGTEDKESEGQKLGEGSGI